MQGDPVAMAMFAFATLQYLGSAIGSAAFSEAFVKMKVEGWVYKIEQLSLIAKTHPHAAYVACTHGLSHKSFSGQFPTLETC